MQSVDADGLSASWNLVMKPPRLVPIGQGVCATFVQISIPKELKMQWKIEKRLKISG